MSNGSAAGIDGFPSNFFKNCALPLSVPLQYIYAMSLSKGVLPKDWKIGKVVPIFKNKGNRSDPINYRPVSLTNISCKIMERVLKKYINAHLFSNKLISASQHGFLAGKSTETQILECLNDWTRSLDNDENVDVIYLDISKAFDTVSHEKLLYKLKKYGFKGPVLKWIRSFLTERFQFVQLNSCRSTKANVKSGVPQGSVLGPVLFLIFINDIIDAVKHSCVKIFADDTKLYFCVDSMEAYNQLLSDLTSLFEWADSNQLKMALQKCIVLHLGASNPKRNYQINGVTLENCGLVKDLGVYVNSDLKPSNHCSKIVSKASSRSALVFKAFLCRHRDFLLRMFCTYVRPILEYNSVCWSPCLVKDIIKVESVQRRYTKRIPGLQNLSYSQRLVLLGLDSLELRRLRTDLIEVFKIVHGLNGLNFNDFFEYSTNHTRGHSFKLYPIKYHKNVRKFYFADRVVKIWNALKFEVVDALTLDSFKRKLLTVNLNSFLIVRDHVV